MDGFAHPPMLGAPNLPTFSRLLRYLSPATSSGRTVVSRQRLCDHDAKSMPAGLGSVVSDDLEGKRVRPMTAVFFAMAICAGIFMVVQASINGQVRVRLADPWQAALISTSVSTLSLF